VIPLYALSSQKNREENLGHKCIPRLFVLSQSLRILLAKNSFVSNKAKMLKRRQLLILAVALIVALLLVHTLGNRDFLIKEHLTSAPPTVTSLQHELTKTQEDLKTLSNEFHDLKTRAGAQAQEAAAAKASLAAIH
jgi:uncharacterized protein YlxW (UPF0749 family)